MKSAVQGRGMRLIIPRLGVVRSCFPVSPHGVLRLCREQPKLRRKLRALYHMLYIFGFIISVQLPNAIWTQNRNPLLA